MQPARRLLSSRFNLQAALPFTISVFTLMLIGLTWDSLNPFLQLGGLGLGVLTLFVWLLMFVRNRMVKLPKVLIPMLSFWGYQTLTIVWSLHPIPALQKSLLGLLLLIFFILIYDTMNGPFGQWTWFNGLLGMGIIISILELALFLLWLTRWWMLVEPFPSLPPVGYRLQGLLLGHANITAGYINLLFPAIVFKFARSNKSSERIGWIVVLVLFGLVEFFASSRGGLLSGALGVGLLLVYLLWERFGDWKELLRSVKARRVRVTIITMSVITLGLALVALFLLQVQKTGHGIGFGARDYIWKPTIAMIQEHPLLGNGWGSFSTLYAQKTYTPPGFATSHAHNLLLQIWAEHGLIGVSLLLVIIMVIARTVIYAWREGDQQNRPYIVLAICSLVPVASHHVVDYMFESPLYTVGVLAWLATLSSYSPPRDSLIVTGRKLSLSVSLVLLVCGISYTRTIPGSFDFWRGVAAYRSGDITVSTEEICAAAMENPGYSFYWFECGLARAFLAEENGSSSITEKARDALLSGLEKDPYWAPHWANMSAIQWKLGNFQGAMDSIATAMHLAPNYSKYPQFQGYLFETSGEIENATQSYLNGLKLDPWLSFDPFFQDSELRIRVVNEFRRTFAASHGNELWGAWYKASIGDLESAKKIFEQMRTIQPTGAIVYAGLAYIAQQSANPTEALTQAKMALFLQPLMPKSLEIAYLAATDLGLTVEASTYSDVYYSSPLQSSQSWQYYNRTYLRFFIPPDTVPQFNTALIGKLE